MKSKLLLLICFIVATLPAYPRAQYSIIQTYGTKCQSCHFNTQGGGLRHGSGFLARNAISLVKPEWLGLKGFFDATTSTNSFFDDKVLFGLDFRYQNAKWGTKRGNMIMQFTPAMAFKPLEWLDFEGFYNIAYDIETKNRYAGQEPYAFSANFRPGANLPFLRVGFFQPTVGLKWDDHTLLVRTAVDANFRVPIIPDDYAEYGAQVDYESLENFGFSAGVFSSKNLAKRTVNTAYKKGAPLVDSTQASYVLRAGYYPQLGGGMSGFLLATMLYNGGFDGSKLANNYLLVQTLSANVGLNDKVALMTEYVHSEKQFARVTDNFVVELNYQPIEGLMLYARGEKALTQQRESLYDIKKDPTINEWTDYRTNQYVFGAHINLLPSIELLPEYRIFDREAYPGYSAQWTFQLHVFF